ncbi:nucleoside deaminase [Candidatus Woesearchaeota archaeon]|nr:nucleoside deaminase [Candidatus Woesearchaeota archaeon]
MKHPNRKIMEELIKYTAKYAKKYGNATGAFLVKGNKIVARAVTTVERDKDPTAHAELKVISKACRKNKNYHLKGYYLYTTQEPCPMCASAIVWARIKGVVYGWEGHKAWKRLNIPAEKIFETSPEKIEVYKKFMEKETLELAKLSRDKETREFFRKKK